jgi:hypothetical protein
MPGFGSYVRVQLPIIEVNAMSSMPSMFEQRPVAETAVERTDYIQPTLAHGLRIWWAFYWRDLVVTSILAAALILAFRPLMWSGKISPGAYSVLMLLGPALGGCVAALPILYFILRKRFRNFRIALVSRQDGVATGKVPANFSRTLRIWWTFSWRTIVYRMVLTFISNIPLGMIVSALGVAFPWLAGTIGFLASIAIDGAVGLFVIYSNILDEDFGNFRVTLVPRTALATAQAAAATISDPPQADPNAAT